jgi:hypothetical protein
MESIESLNQRLIDYYGIAVDSGSPIWRLVWSEDQYEKRSTKYSKEGFELPFEEVRELPKYKQWIHNKWVLEQLVIVPPQSVKELTIKQSYEPLYVFQTEKGEPLPVKWEVIEFIIGSINVARGKDYTFAKYPDPESDPREAIEIQKARIDQLALDLFPDETDIGDALTYGDGIIVPSNYGVKN